MATTRRGLMKLVTTDGHSHWVEPALHAIPGSGYTLSADCTLGGVPLTHYVARDRRGDVCWSNSLYVFPTQAEAEKARDELAALAASLEG